MYRAAMSVLHVERVRCVLLGTGLGLAQLLCSVLGLHAILLCAKMIMHGVHILKALDFGCSARPMSHTAGPVAATVIVMERQSAALWHVAFAPAMTLQICPHAARSNTCTWMPYQSAWYQLGYHRSAGGVSGSALGEIICFIATHVVRK